MGSGDSPPPFVICHAPQGARHSSLTMGRLVVVSNRIADPRKTAAGGLAVALGEVLNNSGGLWFGWSGKLVEEPAGTDLPVQVHQAGPVRLATMDLTREDYDAYYVGYSNGVLWPVLH